MAHSLSQLIPHVPISSNTSKRLSPSREFSSSISCHAVTTTSQANTVTAASSLRTSRRNIAWAFGAALMGLNGIVFSGEENNNALAARPPPTPPKEKTDPNISGVQAKVLASKRRKEAMKEAVAKQRERGKLIDQ